MSSVHLNDILIKHLSSQDIPKVHELHSKLLPVKYPSSFFTQLLVLPTRACFVAYRHGQPDDPIAFISAVRRQPSLTWHNDFVMNLSQDSSPILDLSGKPYIEILTLGVLPAYQQCGLARRLVQCVVDKLHLSCAGMEPRCRTLISATVSTSNTSALKFYECIGMLVSSKVIRNLYRTISYGSRDAYLVVGIL
ncbi:hypothetical protein BYT27DRAFT_7083888 [Phlegmacium glaucopus]|nr:hypothetical protein BYT27DRAFT_7083888 [Phlegmacium glaucopus]